MIVRWYYQLQQKFPNIICHEMIVMPNHFHCIVEIINIENVPNTGNVTDVQNNVGKTFPGKPANILGEHKGSPLYRVVQWFKTMSTNEYIRGVKTLGWISFNGKLWQRNYYEHIIRNEISYYRISEYIRNNPAKWAADKFWGK